MVAVAMTMTVAKKRIAQLTDGGWKAASGKRQVSNGRWQMAANRVNKKMMEVIQQREDVIVLIKKLK